MSIKKSLRTLLIMSSIIPAILVSVIAHGLLSQKLLEENIRHLKLIAATNISGLNAMISTQKTEVSLLSLQSELIEAVKQSNQTGKSAPSSINSLLLNRSLTYENCKGISLFNLNRDMIATSNNTFSDSNTDYLQTINYIRNTKSVAVALGGLHPLTTSNKTIYTIEIGSPILNPDTKNIIGYVISTVDTSYFKNFLDAITIGKTGFGILLHKDGTVIYHPNSDLIGHNIKSKVLSKLVSKNEKGLIPSSGKFECIYHNTKQVYGYCVLPGPNWVLLVKQDVSEINSLTTIMLILLMVICVAVLAITYFLSNIFTKRFTAPIIALRDAMHLASDGDLTAQSNIKNNNEFGELSKNFNKMLHIIKTNYEDLASMHEELLSNEEQLRSNYDHIEYLAYHDTLTNLPNKLAFLDYVNTVLVSSQPKHSLHAVYFIDLDNFKTINDTLGHEYGDELLVKTAGILTSINSSSGMLARAGGDEFLLFRENIACKEYAVDLASKIIDVFRSPLDLNGEVVYVSMSIGIAVYPENGLTSNILIKNSDIAMYKSKDTGKNRYTLFDSKMEEELNRNTLILEVLRSAIENQEIYVQYQPLYELSSNSIIGFEALMRIRNERLGNISPMEFIPIAEESGLIIELSSWLIKEACRFNKNLIDHGVNPRPVSVNISSVQINRSGFINVLSDILNDTQLPPEYLELEITESTLVSSLMDATMLLNNLQNLGVRISLDDFGTGYSSLNYLTKMPINTLKIDKSFIYNICNNNKDAFIAEAIIQLAHSLDIRVVAEGVEHEEQLKLLRSQQCDVVQGYIYSAPLHPSDLLDVIHEDDLITQYSLF